MVTPFATVSEYLRAARPSPQLAERALGTVYSAAFAAQALLAALLALLLAVVAPTPGAAPSLLGWMLVALALLEWPVGLGLASAAARRTGRGAPLYAVILAGVMLSTGSWFLALALLTGQDLAPQAALIVLLALAYVSGRRFALRIARRDR